MLVNEAGDELTVVAGKAARHLVPGRPIAPRDLPPLLAEAIEERRPFVLDTESPGARGDLAGEALRAGARVVLWVPVASPERLVGAIGMDDPGIQHEFTTHEIELVEAVASQAAAAIETATLFDDERERARLSTALAEIETQIHSRLEFEDILQYTIQRAAQAVGASSGAVNLLETDGLRCVAAWGLANNPTGSLLTWDAERHSALALDTGETLTVTDTARDERVDSGYLAGFGITAVIVLPLVVRGERIGLLYLNYDSGPRVFADAELDFVNKLGSSLSLALENARLFEQVGESAMLNAVLNGIDETLNAIGSFDDAVEGVIASAASALDPAEAAIVANSGEDWNVVHTFASEPLGIRRPPVEQLPAAMRALVGRAPVVFDGNSPEPEDADPMTVLRPVMAIPLYRAEGSFGVLMLERAHRKPWTTGETDFAIRLGTHLSLAAQRDALFEAERARARLAAALNDIDSVIHSSLRFSDVMRTALAQGVEVLECDSGSVALREEDRWVVRHQFALGDEVLGMTFSDEELSYVPTLRATHEPLAFHEPSAEGRMEEFAEQRQIGEYLVAPLLQRDELVGLLFFNRADPERPFDELQLEFVSRLSASVSLAIANAHLYERERRATRLAKTLNIVNELLLSTLSPDEMLARIVDEVVIESEADAGMISLPHEDRWRVTWASPESPAPVGFEFELSEDVQAHVIQMKRPLLSDSPIVTAGDRNTSRFSSYMLLPLTVRDEVVGLLGLTYSEPLVRRARRGVRRSTLHSHLARARERRALPRRAPLSPSRRGAQRRERAPALDAQSRRDSRAHRAGGVCGCGRGCSTDRRARGRGLADRPSSRLPSLAHGQDHAEQGSSRSRRPGGGGSRCSSRTSHEIAASTGGSRRSTGCPPTCSSLSRSRAS